MSWPRKTALMAFRKATNANSTATSVSAICWRSCNRRPAECCASGARTVMDETLAQFVRRRARNHCEYCQLPDWLHPGPFELEHIVARQHDGVTAQENLAYSCLRCNRHKG